MFGNSSKIRHLFYNSIKNIVQQRQSGRSALESQITYPVTVFYSIRALLILHTMLSDYQNDYWQHEYILVFAHSNPKLYDSLLAISIIFMSYFIVAAKMKFFTSPLNIWLYFYNLVVLNTDYYRQSLKSNEDIAMLRKRKAEQLTIKLTEQCLILKLVPKKLLKMWCAVKSRWTIWINLDNVHLGKMQQHSIQIYENEAPLELRIKLLLAVNVIDKVCFVIQIIVYTLLTTFCFISGPAFVLATPKWYHIPLIIIDQLALFYAFPLLIRLACIYSLCSLTGNLVYRYKLKKCEELLQNVRHNYRAGSLRNGQFAPALTNHFKHFLAEHTRICVHILYGNSQIWSSMMATFLGTNIPANVYVTSHLIFDTLPFLETMICSVMLCTQWIAAIFVLLRLAKNSKLIHSFIRYIPPIQQMVPGKSALLLKLKLDHLLYRLTSTRYGMTVGPVILVTYEAVFKILCIYIYYLMFAFHFKKSNYVF